MKVFRTRADADVMTVSLGKSPSTALEQLYKETVALVDVISEDGGPGAFINVGKLLQSSRGSWRHGSD